MTNQDYQEKLLTIYLKGEMKLKECMEILNLTHAQASVIIDKLSQKMFDDNYLYNQRMAEVEQIRRNKFTEEEISSQPF